MTTTKTTKQAPTTVRAFKAAAQRGLRKANAGVPLTLEWETAQAVTFPTGRAGFTGWGAVRFADNTTAPFLATATDQDISVA